MSKDFIVYRRLERRLWMTRWKNGPDESAEEEGILDAMEQAWVLLSETEQASLRAEGPRCWPNDLSALPPQFADARFVSEPQAWVYEGFPSALQAIASSETA
jgi:hypothetical protein